MESDAEQTWVTHMAWRQAALVGLLPCGGFALFGLIAGGSGKMSGASVFIVVGMAILLYTVMTLVFRAVARTRLSVKESGIVLRDPGDFMDDQILWASLTRAEEAGPSELSTLALLFYMAQLNTGFSADVGEPRVLLRTKDFQWEISCSDPQGFLEAVYGYRPDLRRV